MLVILYVNFLPLDVVVNVDGIYVGVLMHYADDLLLISSTYRDLRAVTKICEDEMKQIVPL